MDKTFKAELVAEISKDLKTDLASTSSPELNLADAIQSRFALSDGIELTLPPREVMRQPLELE